MEGPLLRREGVIFGKQEQILHQETHLPAFLKDVLQPFIRLGGYTRILFLKQLGVSRNHRQRRLQFMGGVGHKLLLHPYGLFHRLDGPSGKEVGQYQETDPDTGAGQASVLHDTVSQGVLIGGVGKRDHISGGAADPQIPEMVALQKPHILLAGHSQKRHLL